MAWMHDVICWFIGDCRFYFCNDEWKLLSPSCPSNHCMAMIMLFFNHELSLIDKKRGKHPSPSARKHVFYETIYYVLHTPMYEKKFQFKKKSYLCIVKLCVVY